MGIGESTEDVVESICVNSFLADFVVRSPKFTKKSGSELEAADLLLPFGDTLITFQVKTKSLPVIVDDNAELSMDRIRRRIAEAVEQIKTIKRGLETDAIPHVMNLRDIKLPFVCRSPKKIIGIVVFRAVKGGSLTEDVRVTIYGGLDRVRDISVHIFELNDFEVIARECDTLPDLLTYLETREKFIREGILFPITAELDFLAAYKTRGDVLERCLAGEIKEVSIEAGLWDKFVTEHRNEIIEREKRRRTSKIVDLLIEELHKCIGYSIDNELANPEELPDVLRPEPASVEQYFKMASELSLLNRAERMELGQRMFDVVERADTSPKGFSFVVFISKSGCAPIAFVSSKGSRANIRIDLYKIVAAAYVHFKLSKILGIATQQKSAQGRSHDFMLLEGVTFQNEDDVRKLGELLFTSTKKSACSEWGDADARAES